MKGGPGGGNHKIMYLPNALPDSPRPYRVQYDPKIFADILDDFTEGKMTLADSVAARGISYEAFYKWRLQSPELWAATELAKQIVAERTESEILSMVDNADPKTLVDVAMLDRQINARYRALQHWHPEKYKANGKIGTTLTSVTEAIQAARERVLRLKSK